MKICFFTNTFAPHVGGVARSTQTFLEDFRRLRHRVLVVAPEFPEGKVPQRIERSVTRVAALQQFNGSDFSVRLPLAAALSARLAAFKADIMHAHHPFLLGDTALRLAAQRSVPVVFTHHTLYEQYTHYVPFDSPGLRDFVIELSTRFANRCQGVIAPSESVAQLLASRGVTTPIRVVPTGIDTAVLARGDRARARRAYGIPLDAPVIGHVGRLAAEKNLTFLAGGMAAALRRQADAWLLIVGDGPERAELDRLFRDAGVSARVAFTGKLTGRALHDAYAAMDVFAFASHSETQGLVVAEAMATGAAVVALDASGVREIVQDEVNGRLLPADATPAALGQALAAAVNRRQRRRLEAWRQAARTTAAGFDRGVCAERALAFYGEVRAAWRTNGAPAGDPSAWDALLDRVAIEARLIADKVGAAVKALTTSEPSPDLTAPPAPPQPPLLAAS